ncbi:MAG: hypothetical protein K6C94_03025 [Candidatus Gastranaerophilales bacterium]|nr:hypothetical protein [Candidatus Gastranaerophilales bacterium]
MRRSNPENRKGLPRFVLDFVSQKALVRCLDLFAINGVTVLLLASPSASAHRSLHYVAAHFAFCYFGVPSFHSVSLHKIRSLAMTTDIIIYNFFAVTNR